MTQPDKWDDAAACIVGKCSCHDGFKSRNLIDPDCAFHEYGEDVAAFGRSAYAKGERAGMERAAGVCEEKARHHCWNYHLPSVGEELAAIIRAAKETKE